MKKILSAIILCLTITCMLCVWPGNIFRHESKMVSGDTEGYTFTAPITPETPITQTFIAQESKLFDMAIAFRAEDPISEHTVITFTLSDPAKGKTLYEQAFTATEIQGAPLCYMNINKWFHKGNTYTYTITASDADSNIQFTCTPSESNFVAGNTTLTQGDTAITGVAFGQYVYGEPLDKKSTLSMWLFVLTISFSVLSVVNTLENNNRVECS